jgi:hypothetical protein
MPRDSGKPQKVPSALSGCMALSIGLNLAFLMRAGYTTMNYLSSKTNGSLNFY